MTTFQDPPLQSRRAVRQGERADASPSSPFAPPQVPRTAAGVGEPLNYVTQNRPPLPGYDAGAPSHGRRAVDVPPTPAPAPVTAQPAPGAGSFRPRDFSPEARTAPPAWAPEYDRESGVVEYHTQSRSSVVPPASLASSLASQPSEQTLTRRELRAIREAAGMAGPEPTTTVTPIQRPAGMPEPTAPSAFASPPTAVPQPIAPPPAAFAPPVAPAPLPHAEQLPPPQLVEPPASRRAGRRAAASPEEAPAAFESLFGAEPQAPAPDAPREQAPVAPPLPSAFEQPAPQPMAPPQDAPAPESPVMLPPEPVAPVAPAPTEERPVGHWTMQADRDDVEQAVDTTISRRVGSGAITTSALVLPSLPGHDMSTGEVLLTDSVSLPSSLAATGAHSPIDEPDIDHLLDPGDHQAVNTDSVPIRAVRAVSSHTLSRDVIATGKPHRGNRALTILIASASAMVVVVASLLVVALTTGGL